MDSCKQASQILKKIIGKENTILDVACGTGYLFHSLKKENKKEVLNIMELMQILTLLK